MGSDVVELGQVLAEKILEVFLEEADVVEAPAGRERPGGGDVLGVEIDAEEPRPRKGRGERGGGVAVCAAELAVIEVLRGWRGEAVQGRDEAKPRRGEVLLEAANVRDVGDVLLAHAPRRATRTGVVFQIRLGVLPDRSV